MLRKILFLVFTLNSILITSIYAQCVYTKVDAGYFHSLGIKTDNTLWSWGRNDQNQLGDGSNIDKAVPIPIGVDTNWQSVSAGFYHSLAIKMDGTLWAWGFNAYGRLGDGTWSNKIVPTQIGTAVNWQSISAGNEHSTAIKADGTIWSWGRNNEGQLGDGTTLNKNIPTQVGVDTNWHFISYGGFQKHNHAIKTDGTLWAWGRNNEGQLGDGTAITKIVPTQIGTNTNWQCVKASYTHSVGLKTDGTLWAWGQNSVGQLGDGTYINRNVPIQIGLDTNWQSITIGSHHTAAIKTDGTLWAWGFNANGQLGDGTYINKNVPIQIGTSTNWQSISAGLNFIIGLKTDDSLWSWGNNQYGQLGNDCIALENITPLVACSNIICGNIPLQLNDLTFNAFKKRDKSLLSWLIDADNNIAEYRVERSANGMHFAEISKVASIMGIPSESNKLAYEHTDELPVSGPNYYRIKLIDLNGKIKYSNTRFLNFNTSSKELNVYPNPAHNYLQLCFISEEALDITIRIADISGRTIMTTHKLAITGVNKWSLPVSKLSDGQYFLYLYDSKKAMGVSKFVKQ